MYQNLPAQWDEYIRSGLQRISTIDIVGNPFTGIVNVPDIPTDKWAVSVSRRSDIRRTGRVTVTDAALLSRLIDPATSLRPFSAEIRIKSGFVVRGLPEMIPLGVFRIEDLNWSEDESSFEMSLNDRSKTIARTSFGVQIDASGKLLYTFLNDMVLSELPYVQLVIDPAVQNFRFPGGTTYRSGKLSAVHEACEAAGAEFYFDADGVGRVVPVPYLNSVIGPGAEDWRVDTGESGVLVKYSRSFSRTDAYNKIHVYGAVGDTKVAQPYASAQDDDPSSPTYFGGPFGRAEIRVERQELTNAGQCTEYARAYLRNSAGLAKSISVTTLGNHALQEGDTILAAYPDGAEEYHLVDGFDVDQTGSMRIVTRTRGSV